MATFTRTLQGIEEVKDMGDDYGYETEKRNCEICEHYKPDDRGKYSCEKWECEFKEMRELSERSEPKEKQQA